MILAIDFDGTIVDDRYPQIGNLRKDAAETIQQLHADGHYIIIWSCRTDRKKYEMMDYLVQNDIPYHQINKSNPDNVAKYGIDTRKVYADVYIDDKAITPLPEWFEIYYLITLKEQINNETNSPQTTQF